VCVHGACVVLHQVRACVRMHMFCVYVYVYIIFGFAPVCEPV